MVEGSGLENRRRGNSSVSSNLTASAICIAKAPVLPGLLYFRATAIQSAQRPRTRRAFRATGRLPPRSAVSEPAPVRWPPPGQIGQRCGENPLIARGALLHQCRRCRGGAAVCDELLANHRQSDQPHIENQRLRRRGQLRPWQVAATVLQVTGDEAYRLRMIPMGQWNAGVCGATTGCGDSRHHLEWHPIGCEFFDFFTATPEDERIPPLSRNTRLPCFARATSCWLICS